MQDEIHKLGVNTFWESSQKGYVFEVDLEYKEALHDMHNKYQLAPMRIQVEESMLSSYCKEILKNIVFQMERVKRLCQT